MGDETECTVCGSRYDPAVVDAEFRAAYTARSGLVHVGRRPVWIANQCSEVCRWVDVDARTKFQNQQQVERRAARKANEP